MGVGLPNEAGSVSGLAFRLFHKPVRLSGKFWVRSLRNRNNYEHPFIAANDAPAREYL